MWGPPCRWHQTTAIPKTSKDSESLGYYVRKPLEALHCVKQTFFFFTRLQKLELEKKNHNTNYLT